MCREPPLPRRRVRRPEPRTAPWRRPPARNRRAGDRRAAPWAAGRRAPRCLLRGPSAAVRTRATARRARRRSPTRVLLRETRAPRRAGPTTAARKKNSSLPARAPPRACRRTALRTPGGAPGCRAARGGRPRSRRCPWRARQRCARAACRRWTAPVLRRAEPGQRAAARCGPAPRGPRECSATVRHRPPRARAPRPSARCRRRPWRQLGRRATARSGLRRPTSAAARTTRSPPRRAETSRTAHRASGRRARR